MGSGPRAQGVMVTASVMQVGWREGTLRITTYQWTQRKHHSGTAISPFYICPLANLAYWGA